MSVDISRIPKAVLLRLLWEKQTLAGFFLNMPQLAPRWEEPVDANKDFNYYLGRAIKTDLRKDVVNTAMYNRDAGKDAFENIVKELRLQYP